MRFASFGSVGPLLALLPLASALLHCSNTVASATGSGGSASATTSSSHASSSHASGTSTSSTSGTGGAGGMSSCSDPGGPATFELGTGETCFTRLTPGQTVDVMQGPQGGFHIWTAVGCSDCEAMPAVEFGLKDPATMQYLMTTSPDPLTLVTPLVGHPAWPQHAGMTAFLPGFAFDPMSQLPKGTHVVLHAAVLNPDNSVKHSADVEIVLGDIKMWAPPCDPNPMTCGAPGGIPCCSDKGAGGGGAGGSFSNGDAGP